jgi:thiamine kinase-like enzyme
MSELMADRGVLEVEALPCWSGYVRVWPISGGIANRHYGVQQADGQRFSARLGLDLPQHGIMRFNEQAAAKAAAKIGVSPKVFYTAPGVMVCRLLPGRSLTAAEVRLPENLLRIAALLRRTHEDITQHLTGPLLAFWVFHVNRSYASLLQKSGAHITEMLPSLMELNDILEKRAGKVELAFTHNDLRPETIFDDGARLWLSDWDFAGFNSPLFDLADLSVKSGLDAGEDLALLTAYFGGSPPDFAAHATFRALKCAALLREALSTALFQLYGADFHREGRTDDFLARLDFAVAEL